MKWNRSLYGGLTQQEPTDPEGIMERLRRLEKSDETICYPAQYENTDVSTYNLSLVSIY
jgi:hypothetical protein